MGNFKDYISTIVHLSEYIDREAASSSIRKSIFFRGPNVYILACAIIIASVGLNVNSIPVIIGAMLISPLMGPIIGFGLGLGTNDTDLLRSSLKNFAVMVVISIIASTLYFLITPLKLEEPTELLARTNPTVYDVLIALFGGIAGILETSRKEKGTVLSGVAIATALMPPLCTVGYGIAEFNIHYVTGALYLFAINSIFIALAVFLATKYLEFPLAKSADTRLEKRRKTSITLIVLLIAVPSCFSAVSIIRENNFTVHAESLVRKHKTTGGSYIYDHKVHTDVKPFSVELFIAGDGLNAEEKEIIYNDAENYGLTRNQVIFREDASDNTGKISETEIVRGIYEYYDRRIQELNSTITELELELARYRKTDSTAVEIRREPSTVSKAETDNN